MDPLQPPNLKLSIEGNDGSVEINSNQNGLYLAVTNYPGPADEHPDPESTVYGLSAAEGEAIVDFLCGVLDYRPGEVRG